jgi:hypothetical protein
VRRLFISLCLTTVLWAISNGTAHAFTAIFYQPQTSDRAIQESVWQKALRAAKQSGFEVVVFQWTGYGDEFDSPEAQQWLETRMKDVMDADLQLVVGLYADPNMFSAVDVPNDLLEPYFLRVTAKNLALAEHWLAHLPSESLLGWYLPLEVDDRRWRAKGDLDALVAGLHRDVMALQSLGSKPVYMSTFFRGHATPLAYERMLATVRDGAGVALWVQDGRSNQILQEQERALYLAPFERCDTSPIKGMVFEIFEEIGTPQSFKAKPLSTNRLKTALKQRAPCAGDSVFFSLRYFYPIATP